MCIRDSIFMLLMILSCSKDLNDCTLLCGQYDGITKVTVENAGSDGRDLVTKNPSIIFINQSGDAFEIDGLVFTLDKDGEFETFDTPQGKDKVSIFWEDNRLILEEDFGNGINSIFEGTKTE